MKSDVKKLIKRELNNQQKLIKKFIDSSFFSQKYFWPREVKIANKLIKTYDLDFLFWVIPPYNKKIPSLAYFMADYGKQYLSEQFFNYKKSTSDFSPKHEKIVLSQEKIGEDIIINNKPKSIRDFLNLYK
jgi:hypothetical protein